MNLKTCKESRVTQTDLVLPNETNNHNTLFGGVLMKRLDAVASISARRHCRSEVVTASTDSVDFLQPINPSDSICLESFVTFTGTTSMEIFVKAVAEDLNTGERRIAATAFLTFISLDENGKPSPVPKVVPESKDEQFLYETGQKRAEERKKRRQASKELAKVISTKKRWEQ